MDYMWSIREQNLSEFQSLGLPKLANYGAIQQDRLDGDGFTIWYTEFRIRMAVGNLCGNTKSYLHKYGANSRVPRDREEKKQYINKIQMVGANTTKSVRMNSAKKRTQNEEEAED